ncbi:urease accessory protein UreF [Segetibacter sp. 3557_3]|uniref:urease accessory protein UreF n=1 Tax=Segetibacter sp. 3557_3 TaxID=2547429 RepID=UPI001058E5D2|nr:urease accessory protein UreF [Segetibacter sp. 3557_3]TDH24189.1 urease accessory protein UreF [Segetibacter sp. 3557_3]
MFSPELLHLLHLCDPAIPVGSFSHSAGLETYVQAGTVNNKETAQAFIEQQLSENFRNNDAAFASLAWTAAKEDDARKIHELDDICTAVKLAMEMRIASQKTGTRLMKIFAGMISTKPFSSYWKASSNGTLFGHYCLAFGLIAHGLGLTKNDMLTGFYYSAASAFTTNCVKLVPLGQQQGQELLVGLFPLITSLVDQTLTPNPAYLGRCCPGFDLASMQHEQLYSRLYMS